MVTDDKKNNPTAVTIQSSRFGELAIDSEKIITLTSPFLGFPDAKHFVLLPHSKDSAFLWLQSTEQPTLAFVLIQPAIINPDYRPAIPGHIQVELGSADGVGLEMLIMLTIPKNHPEQMTANLLGPIVFNSSKRLARQILLDPTEYDPCWPVLQNQPA